jgi:CRISPR/Cas system-associated exonuclease Cas4 (RecB family)
MSFTPGFKFSQSSLQDYVDCKRRFQLRYLMQLSWPAVDVKPAADHERRAKLGQEFHQIIHQYLLGIPQERIEEFIVEDDLQRWWLNFVATAGDIIGIPLENTFSKPDHVYHEIYLSTPLENHRLVAKYDLISIPADDRALIIDWKTSKRPANKEWLDKRLQTYIYPYLLIQAGNHLIHGDTIDPDKVEMAYWFAEEPEEPVSFAYNEGKHNANGVYLSELIKQIEILSDGDFPLITDERACRYCVYRSFCDRGVEAGDLDDDILIESDEFDFDLEMDFDEIQEIEY